MLEAPINGTVLKWARERAGLSIEELSRKWVSAAKIREWEQGETRPSLSQVELLAKALRIPVLVLLLDKPLDDELPIPDLRTFATSAHRQLSINFRETLNSALVQQAWFRENASTKTPTINQQKYTSNDDTALVARYLSSVLKLNDALRQQAQSWTEFLGLLIGQCEKAGILVIKSGIVGNDNRRKLDLDEFRGFVLPDALAPLVFLNARDSIAAQTFTLMHEVAHLVVDQGGVLNADARVVTSHSQLETFCNQVAAEALVPEAKFLRAWQSQSSLERNLDRIVTFFRVSRLMALRRAFELGKIGLTTFQPAVQAEYERFKRSQEEDKPTQAGGDFWSVFRSRLGSKLVDAVVESVQQLRLSYVEAGKLLHLKPMTVVTLTKGT